MPKSQLEHLNHFPHCHFQAVKIGMEKHNTQWCEGSLQSLERNGIQPERDFLMRDSVMHQVRRGGLGDEALGPRTANVYS